MFPSFSLLHLPTSPLQRITPLHRRNKLIQPSRSLPFPIAPPAAESASPARGRARARARVYPDLPFVLFLFVDMQEKDNRDKGEER